jgi:hypothetical protein
MSHPQSTPEQPPAGSDVHEEPAAGDNAAPAPDELRRAQARRLEIMERERASDEGMPTPEQLPPRDDVRDDEGPDAHGQGGEDDDDA